MTNLSRARAARLLLCAASGMIALGAAGAATTAPIASVAVSRGAVSPTSMKEARQSLARLSNAAMEACGASSFSLREQREAVRGSACWRTSMEDAVARIDNGYLTSAYRGTRPVVNVAVDKAGGDATFQR